jgi:acetyl esterase
MAACGALACDEEKVDKPNRLFDYKPSGVKAAEYFEHPEIKIQTVDEFVAHARKSLNEVMEPLKKIPMFVDAMEKTVTTELTVKKGKISDGDITVYMHRPKTLPEKGCPAMIFVHGGAFAAGSAKGMVPSYAFTALYYEVVGFNVEYRLAPEHGNKGGTDVYAALKYVYDNAEKLGIDKGRIGMEGNSAGVHHVFNACNLMAQNRETGMCKMIISDVGGFYSVLRFTPEKDWEGEEALSGPHLDITFKALFGDDYKQLIDSKDPILFVELVEEDKLKVYPPMCIFAAEFDALYKGSKMIAERLEKVGKLLEFRVIRGLGHAYAMANNKESYAVFADRIACVNAYLKK